MEHSGNHLQLKSHETPAKSCEKKGPSHPFQLQTPEQISTLRRWQHSCQPAGERQDTRVVRSNHRSDSPGFRGCACASECLSFWTQLQVRSRPLGTLTNIVPVAAIRVPAFPALYRLAPLVTHVNPRHSRGNIRQSAWCQVRLRYRIKCHQIGSVAGHA